MPWNLLILPLVGGYYIISRLNYFKFKQQRLSEQRLVFDSILVSCVLVFSTLLLRVIVEYFFPEMILFLYKLIPVESPFIGTAVCTLITAYIITATANKLVFNNEKVQIQNAIKRVGNELELLMKSSLTDRKLLEFTLDTDKVYICLVKELPTPTISNYIRVIPFISGYRDEKKELVFTTQYIDVYEKFIERSAEDNKKSIDKLDVDLIITLDNVVTVSYFDPNMYELFNSADLNETPKETGDDA